MTKPMHRFKAKMMIHFVYTPQFCFLKCLNRHERDRSEFDRAKMYHRFCQELLAEGMITKKFENENVFDYVASEKGAFWVETALSTPLPRLEWTCEPEDVDIEIAIFAS